MTRYFVGQDIEEVSKEEYFRQKQISLTEIQKLNVIDNALCVALEVTKYTPEEREVITSKISEIRSKRAWLEEKGKLL